MNLGNIPAVNDLLGHPVVEELQSRYNREFIVANLRQAVEYVRNDVRNKGEETNREELTSRIVARLGQEIKDNAQGSLCRVINGTGVVLHTNLGRAPIGQKALQKIVELGPSYCNLELDLETGERGSRYRHVEELLLKLVGTEASLVVNNNAAAVLLGINTLAQGREVIVSRGQLIEIGGAFRIPEVMKLSGAKLVEVGTTNKTYISDFAEAITSDTALLFSAHTSNYKIVGFSQEVNIKELADLGKQRGLPVMHDLGSGIFTDLSVMGLRDEPTIQASVNSGVDLITFSGDKLLGGPQAGVIMGRKQYINAMKKNQLTRALRVDKLTIAALEGTLLEYMVGDPLRNIPALRMLKATEEELLAKAERIALRMHDKLSHKMQIRTVKVDDMVGGGAYPTYRLPGYAVELEFTDMEIEKIAKHLRISRPALIARKQQDKMIISVRALQKQDEETILELFTRVYNQLTPCSERRD